MQSGFAPIIIPRSIANWMTARRVGIVGAGIVGLAHAWSAAKQGWSATVFERSPEARGASVRNFGMVYPLSQPDSLRPLALRSRQIWIDLAEQAEIWLIPCGSLHLAFRDDEWQVLTEFFELSRTSELGPHLQLLSKHECLIKSPGIRSQELRGGLASDLELRVDPVSAVRSMTSWLRGTFGVDFHFETTIVEATSHRLTAASGNRFEFDKIIICSGADLETLFPCVLTEIPLTKCKLQMMRTAPQPDGWTLGPHLAGGLTLRHYPTFRSCSSLQPLAQRIAVESPELDRYGIHVLVSQDQYGRVVIGDSHQYGSDIDLFHSDEIDRLILRELQGMIQLPTWQIESRWSGIYAKLPESGYCFLSPQPDLYLCTGTGGGGMTLAFAIAEENWQRAIGECKPPESTHRAT